MPPRKTAPAAAASEVPSTATVGTKRGASDKETAPSGATGAKRGRPAKPDATSGGTVVQPAPEEAQAPAEPAPTRAAKGKGKAKAAAAAAAEAQSALSPDNGGPAAAGPSAPQGALAAAAAAAAPPVGAVVPSPGGAGWSTLADPARFYELMESADAALMEMALQANNVIQLYLHVFGTQEPAAIEVPATATVAYVKRAVFRKTAGVLPPSQMKLITDQMVEMEDGNSSLASYNVGDQSTVFMELMEAPAPPPPNYTSALPTLTMPEGEPYVGSPPNTGKQTRSRRPFSLIETEALVEAVENFGTSWARIHGNLADVLDNRSQVDLKDKWRNLKLAAAREFKDDRSSLPAELKERIKALVVKLEGGGSAAAAAAANVEEPKGDENGAQQ